MEAGRPIGHASLDLQLAILERREHLRRLSTIPRHSDIPSNKQLIQTSAKRGEAKAMHTSNANGLVVPVLATPPAKPQYANYLPDELLLEILAYFPRNKDSQATLAKFCLVNRYVNGFTGA